jgi:Pyruvate/2-oxoacid:ferredoxin oxidoreductase gamma subunit
MSHLRFGKKPIKSTYLIHKANFVACHNAAYVRKYNMVQELVDGGTFLLNCPWEGEELDKHLPGQVKKYIYDHKIKLYTINGTKLGIESGMGPTRINTILQSAFFKLTGIIPEEKAIQLMKDAAKKTYGLKGDDVEVDLVISHVLLNLTRDVLCDLILRPYTVEKECTTINKLLYHVELGKVSWVMTSNEVCLVDKVSRLDRLLTKSEVRHSNTTRLL